jgi:hypothetical protein
MTDRRIQPKKDGEGNIIPSLFIIFSLGAEGLPFSFGTLFFLRSLHKNQADMALHIYCSNYFMLEAVGMSRALIHPANYKNIPQHFPGSL